MDSKRWRPVFTNSVDWSSWEEDEEDELASEFSSTVSFLVEAVISSMAVFIVSDGGIRVKEGDGYVG